MCLCVRVCTFLYGWERGGLIRQEAGVRRARVDVVWCTGVGISKVGKLSVVHSTGCCVMVYYLR